MATKEKITCHVLDTTAGRPARGVRVKLEGPVPDLPPPGATGASAVHALPKTFESRTDDDGRVQVWLPYSSSHDSGEVPVFTLDDVLGEVDGGPSRWTLRFDTGSYFGEDKTFFPEVSVTFRVLPGEHYHVPLLLSPYSYSTYRGS